MTQPRDTDQIIDLSDRSDNGDSTRAVADQAARTDAAGLLGPGQGGAQLIPVNMYETTDALVIVAPMPGVSAEDVEIEIAGDHVELRAGLRTAAPKTYLLHEWEYGLYERHLDLPGTYQGPVTATLGHGQLAVSITREGTRAAAEHVIVQPVGP